MSVHHLPSYDPKRPCLICGEPVGGSRPRNSRGRVFCSFRCRRYSYLLKNRANGKCPYCGREPEKPFEPGRPGRCKPCAESDTARVKKRRAKKRELKMKRLALMGVLIGSLIRRCMGEAK